MQLPNKEILLIDPDSRQADATKALLAEARDQLFSVQHVGSLAEGLDLVASRSFDCVIVHVAQLDGDGLEDALAVRDRAKRVPVVVLTAVYDQQAALKALGMDVQDVLVRDEMSASVLARSVSYAMQRKKVVEELWDSEESMRFASAAAGIGMWHWDMKNDDLTWNDRCKELFGYSPDTTMTYDAFLAALHPEDRGRVDGEVRKALMDRADYFVEMRVILPDRQMRWVMSKGRGYYDRQGTPIHMHGIAMDITERKEAEHEREQLLLQLDSVLESLSEGVAIADLDGNIVKMNRAALPLHQYRSMDDVRRQMPHAQQIFELTRLDGTTLPYDQWPLTRAMHGEELKDYEVVVSRSDTGKSLVLSYNASPVRDASGKMILAVTTMRDITDQKRAEESLRSSERKFVQVFNAAPAVLLITTLAEGRIVDINETALKTLGYRRDELVGRLVHEVNLWETHADRDKMVQLIIEDGYVHEFEVKFEGKNGSELIGLCSAEPLEIDGVQCILSLVKDITERKRAEEAVLQAKEEWERTFDSVPDLIALLDTDSRIVRVNRSMAERIGRRPEECIGMTCYRAFHGVDAPPASCPHLEVVSQQRGQSREIFEPALGRYFHVSYTPLHGPDGKSVGVVHVARDITERKLSEDKIARLNAELAARAAELEAANRELETFNYTVAHDLRQPLNVIYGYCQAVEMLCGERLDGECVRYLQDTFHGVKRMNAMIDTLLNFSRLGRVALRRERVDLSALAQAVAADLRQTDPYRDASFRIAEGITAEGDPTLLRMVLDNLLGNAWKYTAVTGRPALIEFGVAEAGGEPALFVRDNGPGFEMSEVGKLFAPFQRLPGTEERSGFGIGLATVERIIQRHGGRVWAEGEPGKGATFYFTLPADEDNDAS